MEKFYGPAIKSYTGSAPYGGVPTFYQGEFEADSLLCSDIVNSISSFGDYFGYYIADCDFITLSGSGNILFMNPGTMQIEVIQEVTTATPNNSFLTVTNLTDIISIEVGFICSAIILFGVIRQLRKINNVLW